MSTAFDSAPRRAAPGPPGDDAGTPPSRADSGARRGADADDRAKRHGGEVRKLTSLLDVSQALATPVNVKSAFHRVLEILERYHGTSKSVISLPAEGTAAACGCTPRLASARRIPIAAGRHARPPGVRKRPSSGGAARQPRTVAAGAARARRRRRAHVHLRAAAAVEEIARRPRGRARLQGRPQLRPHHQVLRCGRLDAGAGDQDAAAARRRPPAAGGREHAAARRAARALRLLAHPRQQRRDAPGLRTGDQGRAHQHHRADPRRDRAPARS